MMDKLLSTLCALCFSLSLNAQSVDWATDVAPILYDHCVKCHRDGGLAHFSLVGFGNAYSNRFGIKYATEARIMPPWQPDPSYRRYAHENRLTDAEVDLIGQWVDAGAPAGNLAAAPPDPVFIQGSSVGTPDAVLYTPFYTVTATDDEYRCFVVPNGLAQTAYLRGLEALPGNHEVVHHILIYEDLTGQAKLLDAQTPNEPGYVNFGGPGVQGARLIAGWAPGAQTTLFPPFMGIKLTPGADLIVQMHYPKGSKGKSDQTTINLFFTPTNTGIREISLAPALNHIFSLQNGPLFIPANTEKTFIERFTTSQNGTFISAAPHMHLIGRNITSFGVTPQGDTIPFIRINNWNFHWQGGYTFQKAVKIPAGTKLYAYAHYDNTVNNPFQPSNPPQDVSAGEATTDEMMLVYFAYTAYQPGDENIVFDSTLLSSPARAPGRLNAQFSVSPNPASDKIFVDFSLEEAADVYLELLDIQGKPVGKIPEKRNLTAGKHREFLSVSTLPAGVYVLRALIDGAYYIVGDKIVKN